MRTPEFHALRRPALRDPVRPRRRERPTGAGHRERSPRRRPGSGRGPGWLERLVRAAALGRRPGRHRRHPGSGGWRRVTAFQASHAIPTPAAWSPVLLRPTRGRPLLPNLTGDGRRRPARGSSGATSPRSCWPLARAADPAAGGRSTSSRSSPTASRWSRSARSGDRLGRDSRTPRRSSWPRSASSSPPWSAPCSACGRRRARRWTWSAPTAAAIHPARKVQLISALPSVFAALKIAAPAAFLGAVLAEYLGSGGDKSLGKALIAAQSAVRRAAALVPGLRQRRPSPALATSSSGWSAGSSRRGAHQRRGRFVRWPVRGGPAGDRRGARPSGRAAVARRAEPRPPGRLRQAGRAAGHLGAVAGRARTVVVGRAEGLRRLDVRGKSPVDVWRYLFDAGRAAASGRNRCPPSRPGPDSSRRWLSRSWTPAIGFVSGLLVALADRRQLRAVPPVEFAFMPIALLLRSVPLVAIAPVLLLIFGKGTRRRSQPSPPSWCCSRRW